MTKGRDLSYKAITQQGVSLIIDQLEKAKTLSFIENNGLKLDSH